MALTPVPNLATIAGTLAAGKVDVFATRDVYLSSLGAIPDCNIKTGGKVNPVTLATVSGTPTDNEAIVSAFLANPTGRLIVDGGYAIGNAIVYHAGNALAGRKDGDGFYVLAGSNSNAFQNFAHGDINSYIAWNPTGSQAGLGGDGFWLDNLTINCNRGTFPNGNCDGSAADGTINGSNAPNATFGPSAKGPYSAGYWLSGIICVGMTNAHLSRVTILDAPTYHVNLYHCTDSTFSKVKAYAGDNTVQNNTDGFHMNGGCARMSFDDCDMRVGDDPFAINISEGDGQPGGDITVTDSYVDSLVIGRIYGKGAATLGRVVFRNIRGKVAWYGFTIGESTGGVDAGIESNRSIVLEDINVDVLGRSGRTDFAMVLVAGNIGLLDMARCKFMSPTVACPMVRIDVNSPTISTIRMSKCGIHRTAAGNAAAYAFEGGHTGSIGELIIDGFAVTEQFGQSYADISALLNFAGTSVNHLTLGGRFKGVGNLFKNTTASLIGGISLDEIDHVSNAGSPTSYSLATAAISNPIPVSVGRYAGTNLVGLASGPATLSGPGLASSGFTFADSAIADGTVYPSSTQSALCYKLAGVASPFTMGAAPAATGYTFSGPSSGTTGAASTAFAVTPNGVYTGTITITPSGGGLSTPIVKTFSGSATAQTFTITPTVDGTVTLTPTNSGGLTNPSARTYAASTATTGLIVHDTFAGITANASITGRAPSPTQNGSDVWADGLVGSPALVGASTAGITTASGGGNEGYSQLALTGASANQKFELSINVAATTAAIKVQFHRDGSNNLIELGWFSGLWALKKFLAGSGTTVSSQGYSFTTGTHAIEIDVVTSGGTTTVTGKVDGSTVFTPIAISDSALQPAGFCELILQICAPGDITITDFKVTTS